MATRPKSIPKTRAPPTVGLRLRRASPLEADELSLLAREAKAHWGYPPAWLEAWRPQLTLTPAYVSAELVVVATAGNEVAGFFAISRDPEIGWHLEHLWVRPAWMARGVGRRLFAEARRHARKKRIARLHIRSDPNAEGFYLRMGAERIGVEAYVLLGKIHRELPLLVCEVNSPSSPSKPVPPQRQAARRG